MLWYRTAKRSLQERCLSARKQSQTEDNKYQYSSKDVKQSLAEQIPDKSEWSYFIIKLVLKLKLAFKTMSKTYIKNQLYRHKVMSKERGMTVENKRQFHSHTNIVVHRNNLQ